jgi:hypothetical protein
MRQAERELALQAQRAYERTVADWQTNKAGAGATPSAKIACRQKPQK